MRWMRYRIKTKSEAEDIIISTLYDIGLEGAQIEDKIPLTPLEKEQMFVDILPDVQDDDGVAFLNFFVELEDSGKVLLEGEETDPNELKERIQSELDELREFNLDIGEGTIELESTEDIDWINNWKKYFHQFYIDDILVIPSWEEVPEQDKDKMILHIDPGTAFGTGMHETTQLCIRQLRKFINPETVILDVGTGSGILGILSLMMGAKHIVGTDLDPCAEPAVYDNLKNNDIDTSKFDLIIGNIITEKEIQDKVGYEKYDIVAANILADVLVPLTPVIVSQMKKGAVYITSGILNDNDKEFRVKDAMTAAGLEIVETTYQGEWASVTAMKP